MKGWRFQARPRFISIQIASGTSNPLIDQTKRERRSFGCRRSGVSPQERTQPAATEAMLRARSERKMFSAGLTA